MMRLFHGLALPSFCCGPSSVGCRVYGLGSSGLGLLRFGVITYEPKPLVIVFEEHGKAHNVYSTCR